MDLAIINTIIGGLLGGGIIGFIEFLIRRRDDKEDKNKEIVESIRKLDDKVDKRFDILDKKIDSVDRKGDERNAIASRVRILRFRDEMLEGRSHTHDSFQQVLSDIDEYELYCDSHPDFRNNQTTSSVEHIKHSYAERLEKHDFL